MTGSTENQPPFTVEQLREKLSALRTLIREQSKARLALVGRTPGDMPEGAINLANYLSFRSQDLRPLQNQLAELGLSSLGRIEAHVMPSLDCVIRNLELLTDSPSASFPEPSGFIAESDLRLQQNSEQLFGRFRRERQTRIMVTLSAEAAASYNLVKTLIERGMDCARINCSHDDRDFWLSMIRHVRKACAETGHECRILMDLAGHKLRTGAIAPAPAVHHFRIPRNRFGHTTGVAEVLIERQDRLHQQKDTGKLKRLGIPATIFAGLQSGDRLGFQDSRGKKRYLEIVQPVASHWKAMCHKTAYLGNETTMSLQRRDRKGRFSQLESFQITVPEEHPATIRLFRDDRFELVSPDQPGQPAELEQHGQLLQCARISCSISNLATHLSTGDPVWIDDGRLGAVVEHSDNQGVFLKVTAAPPEGVVIREDKGINFPGVDLGLPCLSDKDMRDLPFICQHADIVGFSFVETASDMAILREQLALQQRKNMPVIAKIETNRAVRNLPEIVLDSIGRQPLGIMIARGDLAVELGNARLAEIQEELLWLCDAAHVPVIWATQVLESMARKGVRSRPEFTDAAASVGAECVMLNKGPYIPEAIDALNEVLQRMEAHQHKRFSRLRALHW